MHRLTFPNLIVVYLGAAWVVVMGTGCENKPAEPVAEFQLVVHGEGAAARRKVLIADWREARQYGQRVAAIRSLAGNGTDDDLAFVEGLPYLDRLNLAGTQVADRTLERVKAVPNLSVFVLSRTGVTDAGLPFLSKQAPIVSTLHIDGTGVTDAGMIHLKGMVNLLYLALDGTAITDAGLAPLAELTNMRTLKLNNTGVTGRGLVHLTKMTKLEVLEMTNTAVDDEGMFHLQPMMKLIRLHLANTMVTDRGIDCLVYLPKLRSLNLTGTEVTEEGAKRLESYLPDVKIIIDSES